ncbi:MAG TPA: phosphoribosylamine--glycine ligase [Rhodothermales bacterium]|nr:phosphoribosylamine--glycine ligase [Rhodothermales bacterium]
MSSPGPTVLVVGGGGREHALGWALARSPRRPRLLFAPGNPGTAALGENVPVAADDLDGLVALAQERAVALVVVGPEAALVAGLADELEEVGIPVFGPTADAARIEGSKAWAKAFMARHNIPTAPSQSFAADAREAARAYVEAHALPVVLKADGLAAGKGVVVATTREEARQALEWLLAEDGATCVVEGFMEGEEASVFALCDGRDFVLLAPAQDHKRIGEGDTGPNTGGMGAYAPAPIVTPEVLGAVESEVIRPLLSGMTAEGHPYRGVLYVGLMLTSEGPRVVEFNARFGDPEAQVVLPLLASDALTLFEAVAAGSLVGSNAQTREGAAACVVMAAAGYPGPPRSGDAIHGLEGVPRDVLAFHAGTRQDDEGRLLTSGGRVLGLTGQGSTLAEALARAYAGVAAVHFDGGQFRRDIGHRGLAHESGEGAYKGQE